MSKFIPNSFQLPNAFVDDAIKHLSPTASVLYIVVVRKTRGWQKNKDAISLTQFEIITGLSRKTVIKAIGELIEYGFVKEHPQKNAKAAKSYSLNDGVFSTLVESPLVEKLHQSSGEIPLVTSGEIPHTKTTIKTTNKNNTHSSGIDEILSLWTPDLKMLNDWLQRSGEQPMTQQQVEALLLEVNAHYETQIKNGRATPNKMYANFVKWVKGDFAKYRKSNSSQQKPKSALQATADQWAEERFNRQSSNVIDVDQDQVFIGGRNERF